MWRMSWRVARLKVEAGEETLKWPREMNEDWRKADRWALNYTPTVAKRRCPASKEKQ